MVAINASNITVGVFSRRVKYPRQLQICGTCLPLANSVRYLRLLTGSITPTQVLRILCVDYIFCVLFSVVICRKLIVGKLIVWKYVLPVINYAIPYINI